ncbi:iron-containing alcohol dehydrogenase family protein [Streptomyces sp. ACA25]|uniref:iron-containing alcohol dehydrogenase family protein n=1 Tax=Streptomyces sp. ACA25 TaxID=3022596 RepID=UPI002306E16C|nr:iron-containing alcohol dehydrogenase family protein [Streptomyces sp. ACA25]MDB1089781.1 iron-containing alcohol dehydrogenase family protein [Streptomyces sp. ACA25]
MPLLTRLIPSPLSVDIRPGALDDLAGLLADRRIAPTGKLAFAISAGSGRLLRERLAPALDGADWYEVGGGTLDDAIELAGAMKSGHYDAVVGLGGGKIIDCAKLAASRIGLPLVAVATNLAHDGLCSPVATLDNDAGRGSYGVPSPIAVVIDLDVIRQAPARFVRSGIGDAISNISAVADWELAHRERGQSIDGLAAAIARQAGEAVLRHPGSCDDDAFLTALAEGLVLTGIAMSVAGDSRPASGACHEINHALDLLHPQRRAPHGEQCGLGAAFAMHLRGARAETRLIVETLRRHRLPVLPGEIGFSDDEFVQAVEFAPRTRPGRYTILEHLDLTTDEIRDTYADYVKTIGS